MKINHRVHAPTPVNQTLLTEHGFTANLLETAFPAENGALTPHHQEVLLYLVDQYDLEPEEAVDEVKGLSSLMAFALSEFYEIGLRGAHLKQWIASSIPENSFSRNKPAFSAAHKDAIEYLITQQNLTPQNAVLEVSDLTPTQAQALTLLSQHQLRGQHLRQWFPNNENCFFTNAHVQALVYFIREKRLSPNDAVNKITRLDSQQVEALCKVDQSNFNPHIQSTLSREIATSPFFAKMLNDAWQSIQSFQFDKIELVRHETEVFFVLLTLKKAYESGPYSDRPIKDIFAKYLGYLNALACVMHKNFDKPAITTSEIYLRFFSEDKTHFKNEVAFLDYQCGRSGAKSLLKFTEGADGSTQFDFIDKQIFYYFVVLHPAKIMENNTIKKILAFISAQETELKSQATLSK